MHDTGKARTPVQGEVPNPLNPPPGCAFNPRCPHVNDRCRTERPQLLSIGGIRIACHAQTLHATGSVEEPVAFLRGHMPAYGARPFMGLSSSVQTMHVFVHALVPTFGRKHAGTVHLAKETDDDNGVVYTAARDGAHGL
eukprot:gene41207-65235_t